MTLGNQPAFPRNKTPHPDSHKRWNEDEPGMYTRTYAAIHIMAGLAADPGQTDGKANAKTAVQWADFLLEELEKTSS